MNTLPSAVTPRAVDRSSTLTTRLHIIYALHGVGLAIGALGAASIVGSFLFGWPSIIAVILSYIWRSDASGAWQGSHYEWAIRTFWLAFFAALVVGAISLPLVLVFGLGVATWSIGMLLLGAWAIYRIGRGWLALRQGLALV